MVRIAIEADVYQWEGEGKPLPPDTYLCQPEVCVSADEKLVYFTYGGFGEFRSSYWIELEERPMPAPEKTGGFGGHIVMTLKDGRQYWREVYPFAFYEIKSKASATRDHRAVYLDRNDDRLLRAFLDYCDLHKWGEHKDGYRQLPPRAEHRVVSGSYGRGFLPIYLKPGDWLIKERGREPHALSDADFQSRLVGQ